MMCKYSDVTGYKCPHESLKDNDYCIFHLPDDNKNVDEFNKMIKELLETKEHSINFNGFYFPPDSSDFSAKNFKNKIDFYNTTFSERANFKYTTFSNGTSFRCATFSGEANFFGAIFSGEANFDNAIFSKEANFFGATFSGEANFDNAIFSEEANFDNATFLRKADFDNATFSGEANFDNDTFSKEANFDNATFLREADFIDAIFSNGASFMDATFSNRASFMDATFLGEASFFDATFSGGASFFGATFSEEANFKHAELSGKFEFIPNKSETIIFESTYFSDNVRIKADMCKCSFVNSNIERVDMTDSIWIVDNKPKDSYKIWEERQGNLSSKELEGIYRRLKQSYQKYGDYSTAGKFYYQEMELKREQLRGIEKKIWYIYKKICGYGERPWNVIGFSVLIIFVSSFLFLYNGIELLGSVVLNNIEPRLIDYKLSLNFQWVTNFDKVFRDWLECLYTSVITFTTLGYGDVHPIGWSRIVASVEAGFGIIMTALFIFVFTRKMLR